MNSSTKKILLYEWKVFSRNRFQIIILGITFLFGLYAIHYGKSKIAVQYDVIKSIEEIEQLEFAEYEASFTEELDSTSNLQRFEIASDPSYAWHRHGYHAVLTPQPYSILAIGQRDLLPYYYRLTGMSLYYQLFQIELANPLKLFVGNLDLAFVFVYLFPLLIIAFVYALYSNEKENGTLALLLIQNMSLRKILLLRLTFYFSIIIALGFTLSLTGFFFANYTFSYPHFLFALLWLLSLFVYCSLWFGLLFLIISFKKSSAFNAMLGAGFWLLFLIITPSLVNTISTIKYPLNSTELAGLTRRISLENEDDENEAAEVISEYLALSQDLRKNDSPPTDNNTMAKAYAALNSLKDINSKPLVDQYYNQIQKRTTWAERFNWINPSVNYQDVLTKIAYSDTETYLSFNTEIEHFHEDVTHFYFEKLFLDKPITSYDYEQKPRFDFSVDHKQQVTNAVFGISQILLVTLFFFVTAFFNIRKSSS